MSFYKISTIWKQSFFIWLWTNLGGMANFLFAFPNYHFQPKGHWWLVTGVCGAQIAVATLILVPISHLVFQHLSKLPQLWLRQVLTFSTILGLTGIMWMFVWWWFSGFISYDDNIRGVALGYFLASLLTHTLLYQKTLLTKQQTPVDELKTQAAHKA